MSKRALARYARDRKLASLREIRRAAAEKNNEHEHEHEVIETIHLDEKQPAYQMIKDVQEASTERTSPTSDPPPQIATNNPPDDIPRSTTRGSGSANVLDDEKPPRPVSRPQRLTLAEARSSALDQLASRGYRDRKSGTFAPPEADSKEPERTERLLAAPFAIRRQRVGDAWQALEGFLLFRVNGTTRLALGYRVLVLAVNMGFGALSGLKPLLPEGSALATAQVAVVLSLQLTMSCVCFCVLPDADRIVSRFAGTQFLFEGLSTASLLAAETLGEAPPRDSSRKVMTSAAAAAAATLSSSHLQLVGFAFSLVAMGVPIVQLMEQRALTPIINLIHTKGGNPLALLASAYMLAASMPRKLAMLLARANDAGLDATAAAGSASADAGDEAVDAEQQQQEEEGEGEGQEQGREAQPEPLYGSGGIHTEELDVEEQEEEEDEEEDDEQRRNGVGVSGDTAAMTGVGVSRLLARAFAAKEASSKKMVSLAKAAEAPSDPQLDGGESSMAAIGAAARFRRQQQQRYQEAAPTRDVTDAEDDARGDGDSGDNNDDNDNDGD